MEISEARPTAIAPSLRELIREMARKNPIWAKNELQTNCS
jgi:hypothetical protein